MRKHVKPADAGAAIPDPARGGDLPAEGRVVEWSVHWARYAQRGDVLVTDVADEEADTAAPNPSPAEAEPEAPPAADQEAPAAEASPAPQPSTEPDAQPAPRAGRARG